MSTLILSLLILVAFISLAALVRISVSERPSDPGVIDTATLAVTLRGSHYHSVRGTLRPGDVAKTWGEWLATRSKKSL